MYFLGKTLAIPVTQQHSIFIRKPHLTLRILVGSEYSHIFTPSEITKMKPFASGTDVTIFAHFRFLVYEIGPYEVKCRDIFRYEQQEIIIFDSFHRGILIEEY